MIDAAYFSNHLRAKHPTQLVLQRHSLSVSFCLFVQSGQVAVLKIILELFTGEQRPTRGTVPGSLPLEPGLAMVYEYNPCRLE